MGGNIGGSNRVVASKSAEVGTAKRVGSGHFAGRSVKHGKSFEAKVTGWRFRFRFSGISLKNLFSRIVSWVRSFSAESRQIKSENQQIKATLEQLANWKSQEASDERMADCLAAMEKSQSYLQGKSSTKSVQVSSDFRIRDALKGMGSLQRAQLEDSVESFLEAYEKLGDSAQSSFAHAFLDQIKHVLEFERLGIPEQRSDETARVLKHNRVLATKKHEMKYAEGQQSADVMNIINQGGFTYKSEQQYEAENRKIQLTLEYLSTLNGEDIDEDSVWNEATSLMAKSESYLDGDSTKSEHNDFRRIRNSLQGMGGQRAQLRHIIDGFLRGYGRDRNSEQGSPAHDFLEKIDHVLEEEEKEQKMLEKAQWIT